MAQRKLRGNDMLLYISRDGVTYDTVICLTSETYSATTEEIDAATKCGADTQAGPQKFSLSFEGQIMLDPSGSQVSEDELDDYQVNVTTVYWKLAEVSPSIGSVQYTGTGFISELTRTYGLNAPATFSGKIGIYGTPTKSTATS